ncbi:MAG TPA: rhomboid family intramembrane serine protease [Pseudonocardia sp.]|nr:rhomboid family intramembrane serine protease [Pseudonocardia sp.]
MVDPAPAPRSTARVLPAAPVRAFLTVLVFTVALYVIELADQLSGEFLEAQGIVPRELDGLDGVLWAPLLHDDWGHLVANTLPFLVLGFLVMANGFAQFLAVTATIWVLGGIGVWLTGGANTVHIGASLVIFGWLTFLLFRGFFARSGRQILVAAVLFFFWGGLLLGVLPGQPGISWQAHLFGALAGVLAARTVAVADRRRGPAAIRSV